MIKRTPLLTALLLVVLAGPALAITAPTTGSFGYTVYDIFVVKMLQGAFGFVGALALIIWGASMLPRGAWLPAVFCIVAGGAIIKADSIVSSLGMLI